MQEIIIKYQKGIKSLKKKLINILETLECEIDPNVDNDNKILASKGLSLLSFGERIYVEIEKQDEDYLLNINSEPLIGVQLLSWGKHSKNVKKIITEIQNHFE